MEEHMTPAGESPEALTPSGELTTTPEVETLLPFELMRLMQSTVDVEALYKKGILEDMIREIDESFQPKPLNHPFLLMDKPRIAFEQFRTYLLGGLDLGSSDRATMFFAELDTNDPGPTIKIRPPITVDFGRVTLSPVDWAAECIKIPHSAITPEWNCTSTPWCAEYIKFLLLENITNQTNDTHTMIRLDITPEELQLLTRHHLRERHNCLQRGRALRELSHTELSVLEDKVATEHEDRLVYFARL